ncbi:MAG: RsbRD N-terminal domain-containing protein [Nitrospirae bacterium]|nr:RsbRD N-terminal domain-containing protein [Nitrospirota bacterium]MBF0535253.1 RsbRD N-terminal domain-containing protein [Nitrospirota bacterium]MBF0615267.1 RsbRD N-terminal domain-containing protein [Nitrospirota bacterium]
MNLHDILVKEKSNLLNGWYTLIIQTYPPESKAFLEKKNDPFNNPIGHSILVSIEGVLEELLNNMVQERIIVLLNDIIRVRAVQDSNPSDAISLIFLLKQALRTATKSYIKGDQLYKELLAFEDTIDKLTLISFDIFMQCREDIFNLKVNEIKRSTFMLTKRVNAEDAKTV